MNRKKISLERLRKNDNEMYEQLFEEYFERLHHFATSMVFDQQTAHDIVQSIFVTLYENAAKMSLDTNIGGWLFVSVRFLCLKYLRDRKVEDRRKLLYVQATIDSGSIEWLDDEKLLKQIYQVIRELPVKCRDVAKMRFLRCMKFKDIAEELSISENTAKVQASRAVARIKGIKKMSKGSSTNFQHRQSYMQIACTSNKKESRSSS